MKITYILALSIFLGCTGSMQSLGEQGQLWGDSIGTLGGAAIGEGDPPLTTEAIGGTVGPHVGRIIGRSMEDEDIYDARKGGTVPGPHPGCTAYCR